MSIEDEFRDLDAWMSGDDPGPDPSSAPESAWSERPLDVTGQDEANRVLRRLARLYRDEVALIDVATSEAERIQSWLKDRTRGIADKREWLERGLEGFMRAHHADTGTVTVTLPGGQARLRPGKDLVVEDDTVAEVGAAEYLAEHRPELVRASYALDKKAIASIITRGPLVEKPPVEVPDGYDCYEAVETETGEVLPGVVVLAPGLRKFSYTPAKDLLA